MLTDITVTYLFIHFLQYDKRDLRFSGLTFKDSGMYQCIAENRHGVIYANAELRVIGESKAQIHCNWLSPEIKGHRTS